MRRSAYFFAMGLFAGVIATALLCRCRGRVEEKVTSDTVYIHDTITRLRPTPVYEKVVRHGTLRIPVQYDELPDSEACGIIDIPFDEDSMAIVLPITQRVYEDSLYKAYVSGYNPTLDSISIYQSTQVITNTITKKPRRWGVGVSAGVGFGAVSRKVEPMIGVGVYYRIW